MISHLKYCHYFGIGPLKIWPQFKQINRKQFLNVKESHEVTQFICGKTDALMAPTNVGKLKGMHDVEPLMVDAKEIVDKTADLEKK